MNKEDAKRAGILSYCENCSPTSSFTRKAPTKTKPKKRKPDIPPEVREAVLEADGRRCRRCGRNQNLHLHHAVYRSSGGKHTRDNLITLCLECHEVVHSSKKTYQPLCLGVIWLRETAGDKLTMIARLEKQ